MTEDAVITIIGDYELHDGASSVAIASKEADEIIEYGQMYGFTQQEQGRLVELRNKLDERHDAPFDSTPIPDHSSEIGKDGEGLGKGMHVLSDRIVSGMMAMAAESFSTSSPFITIDMDQGVMLNPVDGWVDSMTLAMKLRDYLTGGY